MQAKNFSVAKRLADFLSDDKEGGSSRSRMDSASNKSMKSVSFLERLTQLQDEDSVEAPQVSSPRIQALQEAQRETTYMSRIQAEKERVAKIRQAREAAEAIQRAWRRHCRTSR